MSPSDINYALLAGGEGGEPPDGTHTALLVVAKLLDLPNGSKLVTEWQSVNGAAPYYWSTWHGFAPTRIAITQEFLDGLGIDRKTITDDVAFEAALDNVQGVTYRVSTSAWSGGTNTFIEDVSVPASVAAQRSVDVPIDDADLVTTPAPALPDIPDDDIPF